MSPPPDSTDEDRLQISSIFYRDESTRYHILPHSHDRWQWFMVIHGEILHTVNHQEHLLTAGQCIFIPPGVQRTPRCGGHAPGYIMVLFTPGSLTPASLNCQVLNFTPEQQHPLDLLTNELRMPGDAHAQLLIESLATQLLITTLRCNQDSAKATNSMNATNSDKQPTTITNRQVALQAIAYMQANMHQPISRRDLARSVHCSEPHFARVFKSAMGSTPGTYLTNLRLDRAKQFLRSSSLSISQIALEVGFQSFSHFTQLFRKQVSQSPSDYRKDQRTRKG